MARLDVLIGDWTRGFTATELTARLDADMAVCGSINSIADIAADPYFLARNMVRKVADPRFGTLMFPAIAPVLSATHRRDVVAGVRSARQP